MTTRGMAVWYMKACGLFARWFVARCGLTLSLIVFDITRHPLASGLMSGLKTDNGVMGAGVESSLMPTFGVFYV